MLTVFRLKDGLAAIIFRWNDGEKNNNSFLDRKTETKTVSR